MNISLWRKKNAINREMEFILEDLRIEVYLTINNNASFVDFFLTVKWKLKIVLWIIYINYCVFSLGFEKWKNG